MHTVKVEGNSVFLAGSRETSGERDPKMAQVRIESYNQEVRERALKTFKKRQDK